MASNLSRRRFLSGFATAFARASPFALAGAAVLTLAVLPLLLLSLILEGPARIGHALGGATWLTIGAVLYIGFVSTSFGYGAWGHLLKIYPAAVAAPFSLLVPVTGTISSALLLGETFGPLRLAGMALIMVGLAVLVLRRRPTTAAVAPAG